MVKTFEESWKTFLQNYNTVASTYVPERRAGDTQLKWKPKWMNWRVQEKIKEKDVAWRNYHMWRTHTKYKAYCRKRNEST